MSKTKLKISITDLISSIEKKIEQDKSKYEKELIKYNSDVEKWQEKVVLFLEKQVDNVKKGNFRSVSKNYNCDTIDLDKNIKIPDKPGLYIDRAKRDINFLKLSQDETIVVSTDSDWAKYL